MFKSVLTTTLMLSASQINRSQCQNEEKKQTQKADLPKWYRTEKKVFLEPSTAANLFKLHPEILANSIPNKDECELLKELLQDFLPKKIATECSPEKVGSLTTVIIPDDHVLFSKDLGSIKSSFENKT